MQFEARRGPSNNHQIVHCSIPIVGRYVTIEKRTRMSYAGRLCLWGISVSGYPHNSCHSGYYGRGCSVQCHCADCDQDTGLCYSTCDPGWRGERCDVTCPNGTWGRGCDQHCHCEDPTEICEHISGRCLQSGCSRWWTSDGCSQPSMHSVTFTARINNFSDIELCFHQWGGQCYPVKYVAEYRVQNLHINWTTTELASMEITNDIVTATLRNIDLYINSIYEIRVTLMSHTDTMQATPATLIATGCSGESPYCRHMCRCEDDTSQLCLLTTDHCYQTTNQTDSNNIRIPHGYDAAEIDTVTPTSTTISIPDIYTTPDVVVACYYIIVIAPPVTHSTVWVHSEYFVPICTRNNITSYTLKSKHITIEIQQHSVKQVVHITPVLVYGNRTYSLQTEVILVSLNNNHTENVTASASASAFTYGVPGSKVEKEDVRVLQSDRLISLMFTNLFLVCVLVFIVICYIAFRLYSLRRGGDAIHIPGDGTCNTLDDGDTLDAGECCLHDVSQINVNMYIGDIKDHIREDASSQKYQLIDDNERVAFVCDFHKERSENKVQSENKDNELLDELQSRL